jgi:glycosyltransferase involved in cell wall biosynthesis
LQEDVYSTIKKISMNTSSAPITTIIITFRRPKLLRRAIISALNQTYSNVRVCVYDDASNDETKDVVADLIRKDSRVFYYYHPKNIGMHANYAFAMSRIETPFFSFLSDDDVFLPEFYDAAISAFRKYPEAMLVVTKVPHVTNEGKYIKEPLTLWDRMGFFLPPTGAHRIAAISHPEITGALFRSEILQTPYASLDSSVFAWDYEILLNISLDFPIVACDCEGALFVQHKGPRSNPSDPFTTVNNCLERIRRVDLDDRFPPSIKAANREKWIGYLSGYLNGIIIRMALEGDIERADHALALLTGEAGQKSRAKKLRLLRSFSNSFPVFRPLLRNLHILLTGIRDSARKMSYPRAERKHLECLDI